MDPINLAVNAPFHPSIWIGTGKEFSSSLPHEVIIAKEKSLKIPKIFRSCLPSPTTGVRNFINLDLPFQSNSFSFHVTAEWFSNDVPRTDPNILLARSIPPAKLLKTLDTTIGQVWLNGGSSIVDPRFNNGMERFPFWVLSLWKEMKKTVQYQDEWRKSLHWLDSSTHPVEIMTQVKDVVEKLPWNQPLSLRGAASLDLTGFLGVSWLSDTQIDMMIDILWERLETSEHNKGVGIELAAFSQEMVSVANGAKPATSKYLSRLADHIKRTHMKTLWFPIHVNNSHWIAGCVDLEKRTFAFGEFPGMTDDVTKTYQSKVTP